MLFDNLALIPAFGINPRCYSSSFDGHAIYGCAGMSIRSD